MHKSNPFPEMNPLLERHWPAVDSRLIAGFINTNRVGTGLRREILRPLLRGPSAG